MTVEEFERVVKLVCPHCRVGHPATQRASTKEFVHTQSPQTETRGSTFSQTMCWADGLRRSDMNPSNEPA